MRSLSDIFRRTKKSAALIPFITAGFPRLGSTPELMRALVAGGADIIEIGVPFSDPMADGVAIQRAGERALKNGMTLPRILAQVGEFREENKETPLVLMGYANSFLNFGREKFGAASSRRRRGRRYHRRLSGRRQNSRGGRNYPHMARH